MCETVDADVAFSSDRALVAEAVVTALRAATGLDIVQVPWPESSPESPLWQVMVTLPTIAIMLCELEPTTVSAAQRFAHAYPGRCLLLTDAARGPLWGAMIEAGVVGILPSSISLSDLVSTIRSLLAGDAITVLPDRAVLLDTWHELRDRRAEAAGLIATLSQRELEVLRLLRAGQTVREIADDHDVAASTVRSQVRSLLRKLHVHSQLAGVAVLTESEQAGGLS